MSDNALPKTVMNPELIETKCCPRFEPAPWDGKRFVFQDKLFVKATTRSLFHIPINMGSVYGRVWKMVMHAQAASDEFVVLSHDASMWRGEHYFAVNKEVPGLETVRLSGTFLTKVFEGPYRDAPKWLSAMTSHVAGQGAQAKRTYLFYTTCPRCAKHYGKNYVVAFSAI